MAPFVLSLNTDYLAIAKLLADHQVPVNHTVAVLGSGAWPRPWSRRSVTRASTQGRWSRATPGPGRPWPTSTAMPGGPRLALAGHSCWSTRPPVGMSGGPAAEDLPVAPEVVDSAETVFDMVALPALTPLVRRPRAQGKQVIIGTEGIALQAAEQFALYTGVRPTDDQVRRASEFSRAYPTPRVAARAFSSVQDASAVAFGPRAAPRPCPAGPSGGEYGGTAIRLQLGRARRLGG